MMPRNGEERDRDTVRAVLAKMNAMLRGRDFAKVIKDRRFDQLHYEMGRLGWRVLTKSLKLTNVSGKTEMRVQLKLVEA